MALEPITREEKLLNAVASGSSANIEPITREEMYLAYIGGQDVTPPDPITRKEQFLYQACLTGGSGGEGITPSGTKSITGNGIYDVTRYANADVNVPAEEINNQDKTITANGEYTADAGYTGLGTVTVSVPASAAPVIQPLSVTANGTYEASDGADGYSPVTVNVAASGGSDDGSFKAVIERTAVNPTLPSDLTSIGGNAFYGCVKLALTSLPDGVTSISSNAFRGCSKLALTSLPEGLTSIGGNAFRDCLRLALTSLPEGLTSIGSNAFNNCYNLTELTFKGKPSSIPSDSFAFCTNLLTINVPWAEGEVYNAPWGATNATINYNYTGE